MGAFWRRGKGSRNASIMTTATRGPTSPHSRCSFLLSTSGVVERAIHVPGVAGVTTQIPLAGMYTSVRTLRFVDVPVEAHENLIAKNVLARDEQGAGWDLGN
jgi:hypothetical protein